MPISGSLRSGAREAQRGSRIESSGSGLICTAALTLLRMTKLSRRDVLRGTAVIAAVSALPRVGFGAAASPIKLGQCSYTFRNFKPDVMIGMLHELGIANLNIKDIHLPMEPLADVAARAEVYRNAGIKLTDAGAIYFKTDTDEAIRPSFEYLKAAQIPRFVGAPSCSALSRVAKFCVEYDIRMGIHNHGPEDHEWPSPYDIQKVIEPMDHRVGYCIDLGHTLRTKTDPVAAIRMAGARLYDIHMKDLADPLVKESQVAVGDGVMPVRKIFEALIDIKYDGYVDLEYEIKPEDPAPGVRKSFAYMRKVLGEMGYSA